MDPRLLQYYNLELQHLREMGAEFAEQAWGAARSAYAALGSDASITLDDLERYAVAAHLVGDEAESRDVLARGYREALRLDPNALRSLQSDPRLTSFRESDAFVALERA